MTPEQQTQLENKLCTIRALLRSIDIPPLTTLDDLDANQLIANTRMKLHLIDLDLMGLYRLMATFAPNIHPRPERRAPTIDDLEI